MPHTFTELARTLPGRVDVPGGAGYDAACAGFDLSAVPRPEAAVSAADEADVVAAVRFAAAAGMPVAVRATGHAPIAGIDSGVLINTAAMSGVSVDAGRRTATVGAGVTWAAVLDALAGTGLAPLCGSALGVGAVAYTLGGGLGPLGRRFGYAADHVRRLRLVTASGEPREIGADDEPELFWAVRGGGGGFGVVTEVEMGLVELGGLYGGALFLPGEAAAELVGTFGRCTADVPDALTLSIAFISLPALPALPAQVRGRFVGHVRVAHTGEPAEAEALIAPLRAVATPLLDTVRAMPVTEIGTIHSDPAHPQPVASQSQVLTELDGATAAAVLGGVGASQPFMLELRHLGGALGRPADPTNAVGHRDAAYNLFTSGYPGPGLADAARRQAELHGRIAGPAGARVLYNFLGSGGDGAPPDAASAFDATTFARLRAVKAAWDPHDTFRFTCRIPPG